MTRTVLCSAQHWEPGFGPCLGGECVHNEKAMVRLVENLAIDMAIAFNVDLDEAVSAIRTAVASLSVVK